MTAQDAIREVMTQNDTCDIIWSVSLEQYLAILDGWTQSAAEIGRFDASMVFPDVYRMQVLGHPISVYEEIKEE